MSTRTLLLCSLLVLFTGACHGPDREPGDDPTRSDEGLSGRPESDPADTVDQSGMSGGRTTDAGETADDENTTLDGASDEVTR